MLRPLLLLLTLAGLLAACDEFADVIAEPDGFTSVTVPTDAALV